ncbi:alpha-amylase family glycosyl hydrolase [Neobacillus sp. DY30]|uniref:alpha-amylase family glycosyl hydrolase n=1 Tax=Neobacillus sp. DY30 TaxID=3047871 RepID=UPI0024C0CEB4|nr:alpha-amylase family glycosyl hydrolase [Neobacillus sp. DY30]WHY02068.1 alpha-amylase family glycosyl hydrolase [Neobacillus sp. DY30]
MKKTLITLILICFFVITTLPVHAEIKKEDRQWQDETIYSIMVDRFFNANTNNDKDVNTLDPLAYNGGDFQGVIDKLDYLKEMGFTTIRLTSIFDNTAGGYHGYWVNDFYKPDEHFGSMKTFKKLVQEAHKRDMKVVIDFVTNNVSAEHPWLMDSTKKNWFHEKHEISSMKDQDEMENGWVNNLPDLNQDNPEVRDYLLEAAKWWINNTDIDGYSLPEVNHVPVSFWSDFSKEVKSEKENFFLLGITSPNSTEDFKKYENAGIDSLTDYQLSKELRNVFAATNQSFSLLKESKVQTPELKPQFFDNESTSRFTQDIVTNKHFPGARWKTALTYIYSTPGIPVVFYGSEIALNGGEVPDNHQPMNFRAEKELIDFITKLGELRNQLPSLTRGSMEMLYEKNGMAIYKRVYQNETAIIAINNTSESQYITLNNEHIEADKELRGLLNGDLVRSNDNQYDLIIDRDESEIYVLTEKSGINLPLVGSLVVVYILFMIFILKIRKRNK